MLSIPVASLGLKCLNEFIIAFSYILSVAYIRGVISATLSTNLARSVNSNGGLITSGYAKENAVFYLCSLGSRPSYDPYMYEFV